MLWENKLLTKFDVYFRKTLINADSYNFIYAEKHQNH